MKTPIQELIEQLEKEYKKFYEDTDVPRWFYNNGIEQALKHAKSMLEKEKEVMCEFAEYTRKCGFLSDQRGLMTTEELYDQTFNTKEK